MRGSRLVLYGLIASAALAAAGFVAGVLIARVTPPRGVVSPRTRRVVAESRSSKIRASYSIKNEGGRDLVIGKVESSCGCTVASISPMVVKPGGSATVTLEGSPTDAGEKDVVVRIETNGRPEGVLALGLTMVGAGQPPYVAYGSQAVPFGVIREPVTSEEFQIITREKADGGPWIGAVKSTLPGLSIAGGLEMEVPLGDVVSRHYRYQAKLKRPSRPGEFSGEVLFLAGDGSPTPVHRIPVRGMVRAAVFSIPSSLYASVDPKSRQVRLNLTIGSEESGYDLEVVPAAENAAIVTTRRLSKQPGRVAFEVTLRGQLSKSVTSTLKFDTNHPQAPKILVPIAIRLPEG